MTGPYKPGDVIPAQVTAAENISSIAKSKFIKVSGGTITDITSAVTLAVTGTGTQNCEVKWTVSSGYAAGDVVSGTVVVTLATSGAQPPVPLHPPVKLVAWGASSLPASPAGQLGGVATLVENDGGNVGLNVSQIAGTSVTSSAVVAIDFADTVATRENQTTAQTSLTAIKAKTDNLPASPAAVGSAMTLTTGERTSIAAAVWANVARTLTAFGFATGLSTFDPATQFVQLATTQPNYAPAKAGDDMGLTAGTIASIQSGLSTVTTTQVRAQADAALAGVGLTTTVTGRIDVPVSSVSGGAGGTKNVSIVVKNATAST